nr:reverse transcriptase domain-containing protein [Tanacetum cinerariifolium]
MITSLALWWQPTKENRRCRFGAGCFSKPWIDQPEGERFALTRKCSKDPTEVSKIIRRANETLPDFKERWSEKKGYIQGVSELMQISTFMSNSKCPELARRFAYQDTEERKSRQGNNGTNGKIINMVWVRGEGQKRRTNMKELRVISSITHVMMKFPTPRGVATLVARTPDNFECRWLEEKQIIPEKNVDGEALGNKKEPIKENILVNPAFPEQRVTIDTQTSPTCLKRSKEVTKEVEEWFRAGIVRPVRYSTWISNPMLVKKVDDTWRMCIDGTEVTRAGTQWPVSPLAA